MLCMNKERRAFMKKKIAVLTMAALMAVSAAGCSGSQGETEAAASAETTEAGSEEALSLIHI